MIKLIVSDIDGTLVKDGENQINPEIFDVIMELKKKKKIHFAAASGRQAASIEYTFSPIKRGDFLCGGEWLLSGMLRKKSFSLSH